MNSLQGKSPWTESISPVGTTPKIGKISPLSCSVLNGSSLPVFTKPNDNSAAESTY
jgi:hypothetical protein